MADIEQAIKTKIAMMPKNPMLSEEVGPEEIAQVVSRWTGIPVNRLQSTEREKLLQLKEELHKRVVGESLSLSLSLCPPPLTEREKLLQLKEELHKRVVGECVKDVRHTGCQRNPLPSSSQ